MVFRYLQRGATNYTGHFVAPAVEDGGIVDLIEETRHSLWNP